ncbi:peptide/nickel transport system permease protein [Constrictibacter sp. MBR-5]|jgi:peptide/nickel transport system permease protein|uniref:ABC transporter permease n=1 Tax=Constrictibacter sp. MBR-5 TaxID=3156467 RepID=UPI003398BFC5
MLFYILRRILYAIPISIGVSVVCFSLVYIGPGDPLSAILPAEASQEIVDRMKREYGLDKPLPVQYLVWLGKLLTGDLGISIQTGRPVIAELGPALVNSVILAVGAALVGFGLGSLFGGIAGYNQGRPADRFFTAFAITGVSVPHYWLAIVLVIIFSVELGWLPSLGMTGSGGTEFTFSAENFRHMVLPVIALSVIPIGILARTVRGAVSELLAMEFVEALRSKGLSEAKILRHVTKNVAPQALAVVGLQLGSLLGGSILVETVFAWPGTGLLLNNAIFARDIPMLQGTILVLALIFVSLNLIVDVIQASLDPRIAR